VSDKNLRVVEATETLPLLASLRDLIAQARLAVARMANITQVQTYWEIGRHIVEFEQGGAHRAAYGKSLLATLAEALTRDFGKGYDATNLRHMRAFYLNFPIRDALRRELSWTHYRLLFRVDLPAARQWYLEEAASQNWSTRVLERQIATLSYERLLSSQGNAPPETSSASPTARNFVRDPVMLEFLGLPDAGRLLESNFEQSLMDQLQLFLLELGKGFAFVARQQRISSETQDFFVDLVFYNYLLKCFVLIDLKTGHLTHQDIGQMDMYVRMFDDLRRGPDDNPTVGLLLCGSKDLSVVRYSVLNGSEQLFASKYRLVLPTEDELRREIEREQSALVDAMLPENKNDGVSE
jgi:predicted nuclease of restriction endonuclease-like (RecB) superfamily